MILEDTATKITNLNQKKHFANEYQIDTTTYKKIKKKKKRISNRHHHKQNRKWNTGEED